MGAGIDTGIATSRHPKGNQLTMKRSTEAQAAMFNQLYSSEGSTRERLETQAASLNKSYKDAYATTIRWSTDLPQSHPLVGDALDLLCVGAWTIDQLKDAYALISHMVYATEVFDNYRVTD